MSDYVPNPGRGTLFRQPEDKPAVWSGKIALPDGTLAFFDLFKATDRDSGELKRDREGQPYYNVRIKPLTGAAQAASGSSSNPDDYPF